VLGLLAVGCPVCNKLVVVLLGVSGALALFAPIQPFLALGGLALLALALRRVVRAAPCPAPAAGWEASRPPSDPGVGVQPGDPQVHAGSVGPKRHSAQDGQGGTEMLDTRE